MNLFEVREKFLVGSKVKVTNNGNCYSSYRNWALNHLLPRQVEDWERQGVFVENGDVGVVLCVYEHGLPWRDGEILVAVEVKNKKIFIMGYEGIEPYDPSFDDAVLPEPKCETSYTCTFNGEELIVHAYGQETRRDVQEIIDEMISECHKKTQEIREGDYVVIVDAGDSYDAYIEWIRINCDADQMIQFAWETQPVNGSVGKVIKIRPHTMFIDTRLCLVAIHDGDKLNDSYYLLGMKALRKATKEEAASYEDF